VDEIALLKGHRDFVVIVTARLADGQVVLLGVLPDRKKKTVADFLRSIPERLKSSIHSACCDMYEGYTEALSEELPKSLSNIPTVTEGIVSHRTFRAF
jgi:transposase